MYSYHQANSIKANKVAGMSVLVFTIWLKPVVSYHVLNSVPNNGYFKFQVMHDSFLMRGWSPNMHTVWLG